MAARIHWYFDFISPFSFLQAERLAREPLPGELVCTPILFAATLDHWGNVGPAEIEPKRRWTYRYCLWRAQQLGVEMRAPRAHPFNPLPLLRLAIALDSRFDVMLRLFRYVWTQGCLPDDAVSWNELTTELGLADPAVVIGAPAVKERLRRNTEEAIALGVFGVPTLVVERELFWGEDATQMCADYLAGAPLFQDDRMRRVDVLPTAAQRTRKS